MKKIRGVFAIVGWLPFAVTAWAIAMIFLAGAPPARAIPQPMPVSIVNTIPTFTEELDAEISVGSTVTTVAALAAGRQAVYLQNLSTSAVCCSKKNTVTCSTTPTNAGTVLKAGTAAGDGTGGTWSLSQFNGPIYCIVATGTALIGVSSFLR